MSLSNVPAQSSRGDDAVLAAVFKYLQEAPSRVALRRVGFNAAASEDICQQTAVDLLLYWDRQGGLLEADARRVMWKILRRRVADHYRARRDDEELGLAHDMADPCAVAAFSEVLDDIAQPQIITALLCGIPPRQREALVLIHIDQLDKATAAESLGISISGLRELLDKGIAKLRANYAHLTKNPEDGNI